MEPKIMTNETPIFVDDDDDAVRESLKALLNESLRATKPTNINAMPRN